MIYLASSMIAIFLGSIETSFLPHFKLYGATPFLMLAFIVALSLRNKGYFQIFIAFAAGIYYDHISGGFPYTFILIFVLTALICRILLYRETSYDILPTYLTTLGITSGLIYILQMNVLFSTNFVGWQSFLLTAGIGIFLTLLFGLFLSKLLGKYFDWLAEETEERFRG